VVLKNLKTGECIPIDCYSCFLFIGYIPNTDIYKGIVDMTSKGYILTDENMQTNVPGVFAAGDVRERFLRQVATCVGDAATAGVMAEKYIADSEIFEHQIMKGDGVAYVYNAVEKEQREMLAMIEEIENSYTNYCCHRIDTYKSDGLAKRLGVTCCPSVVIIKDGKVDKVLSSDICKKSIEKSL
jgi:thioredoxin reductase (NADPH)